MEGRHVFATDEVRLGKIAMGRRTGPTTKRQVRRERVDAPTLVPLLPAALAADGHEDILADMAAAVADENPGSTADALRLLRLAYPHHPLALRLAALAIAMKHGESGLLFASRGRLS
jgi:hypothetical protein